MNNRLQTIFNLINSEKGIIDVGTDHGYIPIALAENGYKGNIFASDINIGPLNSAKENAEEHFVDNRIVFFLSDGLKACPPDKVDTVIIAGMGGDLISRILGDAPWCINPCYRLILQPMTKQEVLRRWLLEKGFSIKTFLAPEKQRYYQIICAEYTGELKTYSPAQLITGDTKDTKSSPYYTDYINYHIKVTEKELNGQLSSKTPDTETIEKLKEIISELLLMKESVKDDE